MNQKRILIVDDRKDNRRIFSDRLRKMRNFEILMATSGQEALDIVSREPLDLIFIDLKIPVMDGWEVTRRIRAMGGPMQDVPILALVDQTLIPKERLQALAAGCNDLITESLITLGTIQEKVKRFLANGTGG